PCPNQRGHQHHIPGKFRSAPVFILPALVKAGLHPLSESTTTLYATKPIYPRALEFATFFFCVLDGPIRLSQRLHLFVSFAKFSNSRPAFFRNDECGFPHSRCQ